MNKENSIPHKRVSISQLQFLTGLSCNTLLKAGMRRRKDVVLAEEILKPHLEAAMQTAREEYLQAIQSMGSF